MLILQVEVHNFTKVPGLSQVSFRVVLNRCHGILSGLDDRIIKIEEKWAIMKEKGVKNEAVSRSSWLGGGFKCVSSDFYPKPWEMIQFDEYFSIGLKPPSRWWVLNCFSKMRPLLAV